MLVNGKHYRTVWYENKKLFIIDQRNLPHEFNISKLSTLNEVVIAIKDMHIRGAGLIGAVAAFGMCFAFKESKQNLEILKRLTTDLLNTRPTAVNLSWAISKQMELIEQGTTFDNLINNAIAIADDDSNCCEKIGIHGIELIEQIYKKTNQTVNILTHCNAGWLAFVDFGTAPAPIYAAKKKGIPVHVYVDETRPRNQGARLTAWELVHQNIDHTIITDNTGGHLMQHGLVDMVITGCDRMTLNGDAANKIGTYLKALAAKDNDVPFYVALPHSTIDLDIEDGIKNIQIEERDPSEVKYIQGLVDGELKSVLLTPLKSKALNFGFDVTPSRLITKVITEKGIFNPSDLKKAYLR